MYRLSSLRRAEFATMFIGALVGTLIACSPDVGTTTPAASRSQSAISKIQGKQTMVAPRTFDDEMESINSRAPGFAGVLLDSTGRLVVLYAIGTDPDLSANAVSDWFASLGETQPAPGVRRAVKHSFMELRSVVRMLHPHSLKGVNAVDVNELENRVVLGVNTASDSEGIITQMVQAGIGNDLVAVRVTRHVHPASTLWDYLRPILGGVYILISDTTRPPNGGACSSGFVARIGNWPSRYVLTASHCTPTSFGYDPSAVLFQPDWSVPNWRVGVEVMDPPPYYDAPMCNPNTYCRQSDVALYESEDASTSFAVARTTWVSLTPGTKGSLDVTSPAFNVTGVVPYSNLIVGQGLQHVGRTTGWSAGQVIETCQDFESTPGSNIWIRCNFTLLATVGDADSGSPVFQWYGGSSGYAANAAGIVWARGDSLWTDGLSRCIGSRAIFSPWQQITYDFGSGLSPAP